MPVPITRASVSMCHVAQSTTADTATVSGRPVASVDICSLDAAWSRVCRGRRGWAGRARPDRSRSPCRSPTSAPVTSARSRLHARHVSHVEAAAATRRTKSRDGAPLTPPARTICDIGRAIRAVVVGGPLQDAVPSSNLFRRCVLLSGGLRDRFKMSSACLPRGSSRPAEAVVGDRRARARRAVGAGRSAAAATEAASSPLSRASADR
jgi:hypothetical protein